VDAEPLVDRSAPSTEPVPPARRTSHVTMSVLLDRAVGRRSPEVLAAIAAEEAAGRAATAGRPPDRRTRSGLIAPWR